MSSSPVILGAVDVQNDGCAFCFSPVETGSFPRHSDGPASGEFLPVVFRGVASNPASLIDAIGMSFNREDGGVIRLLLTHEEARSTALCLLEYANVCQFFTRRHSAISSGNPSVDVSAQDGCEKP